MNKLPFEDESPAQQRDLLLPLSCWFHEGWAWKILPCVHVQRLRKARGCLTHGNFLKRPKIRSCRCKRRWRTAPAISLKSPAVMLQLIDCNVDLEVVWNFISGIEQTSFDQLKEAVSAERQLRKNRCLGLLQACRRFVILNISKGSNTANGCEWFPQRFYQEV